MAPAPKADAGAFAEHLNSVLNQTVTDSRLTLVEVPGQDAMFRIARFNSGVPTALELRGSSRHLFFQQTVRIVDEHVQTLQYCYQLQDSPSRDDWLVRWDYVRHRPKGYDYALGHLHLNADRMEESDKPFGRLHIPTARVPVELIVWHLIAEHGVKSKAENWQDVLSESRAGFEERRTAH